MENKTFEKRKKEENPVLAICYDFDKTLSPDDMQAQGYIQSVGYDVGTFWKESNGLAEDNDMDQNLAWMFKMKEKAHGQVLFTKEKLLEYGAKVSLFPGVEEWFERIRHYGAERNVKIEHYIISSGLKEMIEGTKVARNGAFERIYASSFYYDQSGVAVWPAQVVNYTNKTQFLFRIKKGVLDANDFDVNDYFAPEDIRVPFQNMIYIGDSDTDIPCMKLVNANGGHSIGVYNSDKTKVHKMMRDGRIRYFVAADYTEGSELDMLVKSIIERTAANEVLEEKHFSCKRETNHADKENNEEMQRKVDLLISLENSRSFARTHSVIASLSNYSSWSDEEKKMLIDIAIRNSQVRYILTDRDVKAFYEKIISEVDPQMLPAIEVKNILNGVK